MRKCYIINATQELMMSIFIEYRKRVAELLVLQLEASSVIRFL